MSDYSDLLEEFNKLKLEEIDELSILKLEEYKLSLEELKIIFKFYRNLKKDVPELLEIGYFAYCTREIRKSKKLTQKELSKKIDVSENTIYNYENGKTKPSTKTKSIVKNELCISDAFLDVFKVIELRYSKEEEKRKKELYKDNEYIESIIEKLNNRKNDIILKENSKEHIKRKDIKF